LHPLIESELGTQFWDAILLQVIGVAQVINKIDGDVFTAEDEEASANKLLTLL
jgi:hypothetical protein